MNLRDIVREIFNAAGRIREPYSSLSEDERHAASVLMVRFEEAEAKYGVLPYSEVLRPMLLSKNGRYEEALSFAEQRYQQSPNWETAVAVANAARRAENLEHAVAMFRRGAEHDPDDLTCFLEIGDIRLELSQYAEALAAYEQALGKDPRHQWALPSAFYCRHRLGIDGNWHASLHEIVNQQACTCGLAGCLTSLFAGFDSHRGIERATYLLRKLG